MEEAIKFLEEMAETVDGIAMVSLESAKKALTLSKSSELLNSLDVLQQQLGELDSELGDIIK